ncbi:MAG UNVERIFIED_CONTAM: hypothetical protein LVQ98_02215 [Rickettsiaceae bacterium]
MAILENRVRTGNILLDFLRYNKSLFYKFLSIILMFLAVLLWNVLGRKCYIEICL